MDEEEKNALIEYIVRNQYALTYDLAKKNETLKQPDSYLKGKNLEELIFEIPELLEQIDSANLVILATVSENDYKDRIITELSNRISRGESVFYCGRVEHQLFARFELNNVTFSKLFKINPEIKNRILQQKLDAMQKNPRLFEIVQKANDVMTIEALYESQKRGYITNESLEFLESLVKQNPNILDTMDMRMLDPEVLSLNRKFLERVARYRDQSTELIIIYKTNPELFRAFASRIDEWENTLSRREASNLEKAILRYAAVYAPSMNYVKEDEFDDVLEFCLRKQNFETGEKPEYRTGIREYYYQIYDKMIDEKGFFGKPDMFSVPDAYCMKYLGNITRNIKTLFDRKYGNVNLEKITDPRMKTYIEMVQWISSLDFPNPEDLEKIIELYKNNGTKFSPRDAVAFEEQVNSIILETYEKGFIDTQKKIEEAKDVEIIDYNGQKIRKINMAGKYSVIIRSTDTGFCVDKELENDSVKEYDEHNPDPAVTIKSCAYITEDLMGMAPLGNNGAYLVYLNNNRFNMGEIGNGDLDSNIINYGVSSRSAKSLTSDKLVSNTRQVYAEATLLDDRKPDAIALFDDSTDRQRKLALQAAAEYGVDIIYFDKEIIVDEQISRLDEIMSRFKETGNLDELAVLISSYETNVSGWLLNRDNSVEDKSAYVGIDNRRFLPKFNRMENDIYKVIAEFCSKQSSKESIMGIISILQAEQTKYDNLNSSKVFPKIKMKFKAQELIEILNKKYELGLNLEYSEEASILYADISPDEVMPSIAEKVLVDDMETPEMISKGKLLIEQLDRKREDESYE